MSTFYNLLSSFLFQGAKTQNENAQKTTAKRMSFVSYLAVILLSVFGSMNVQAQISNYLFSATSATYTPITGTTLGAGVIGDDNGIGNLPIGFTFTYGGAPYTVFGARSNGLIELGQSSSALSGFSSNSLASNANCIAPLWDDNNTTGATVIYATTGAVGSQILTVQYTGMHVGGGGSAIGPTINFQILLYEATGVVQFVYGATSTALSSTSASIGLSGTSAGNYLSVTPLLPVATSTKSSSTENASVSAATNFPTGTTYTFTPPPPCVAPTDIAASASSTLQTTGSITASFTAATTAPTGYVVVRTSTNVSPTLVTGTTYTAGTNALGYIEYVGTTASTWTSTGLSGGTNYYYWVFSYNSAGCGGGPIYSATATTFSQATSTCPTFASTISIDGATAVPGTSYPTLTAAIADIKTCGITQPTILELATGYVAASETFPITLNSVPGASAVNTITIREATGVTGKVITSTNTTATIDINGGNYWIIDGRSGGTGSTKDLSITNTSTTTGGTAIRFINGGSNNVVKYTSLLSSFPSTTSGVVVFSTGSNANNTIDNCSIDGNAGATATPTLAANNGVYSSGSANNNNAITNCTIFNNWVNGSASVGVLVGAGSSEWTITGNSLYQTTTRVVTTSMASIFGIQINNTSGYGHTISNNKIGGTAANCGGTAYTVNLGTGTYANRFIGINLSVGTVIPSSVQGNTIANHKFNSSSGTTVAPGVWCGIHLSAGNANIGTVTGNTIGSTTGVDSIIVSNSATASTVYGINAAGTTYSISNNSVGAITTKSITTAMVSNVSSSVSIVGINTTGGTTVTIDSNVVGSTTTANSLNSSIAYVGTTANTVNGIQNSSAATIAITNNTIANLNSAYVPTAAYTTNSVLRGIASSSGVNTITGNTVRNLTTAAQATGVTSAASILGISFTSTTATAPSTVSQNTIYALSNTSGLSATSIAGIYFAGPTTTASANVVAKNKIYNLNLATVNPLGDIRGLVFASGFATVQNNTIRLGYTADGSTSITNGVQISGLYEIACFANSAIYHNTVYVGGTGVATGGGNTTAFRSDVLTNIRSFQNNIFVNARSNASTGGTHYAARIAGTTLPIVGLTSNYNIFRATGTGAVFGLYSSLPVADLAAWKVATGQDANSIDTDPCLAGPTAATPDLHLTTCSGVGSPAESAGTLIASVTDDFEGQTRSTLSPVDIGADAGLYGAAGIEIAPLAIVSPAVGGCKTNAETVSVSITNNNSQTIDFATNNVTVTVVGTGVATYNQSVVLNTGTLASGASQTVTMPATIDMSASGAYALTASTSVTGDLNTSNDILPVVNYNILSLGGTYTVGTGGTYPTITAAVADYNAATCFTSNVVFSLTDALYDLGTTTTPLSVNSNAVANLGSYTLTIKPATGVTSTITGAIDTNALLVVKGNNIIVDGSNTVGGTSRDLTITNTSITTPNVIRVSSTGTTPVLNATVKNTVIVNGINTSSAVAAVDATNTANPGYFNGLNFTNNEVKKSFIAYFLSSSTGNGSNATVSNNKLNNSGVDAIRNGGIYLVGFNGITVTGNSIGNFDTASGESDFGIALQTGCSNATVSNNTISGLGMALSSSATAPYAVYVGSGILSANISVIGNTISDISSAYGGGSFIPTGIWVAGSTAGVTIEKNKISNIKNNYPTYAYGAYGIRLGSSLTTANVVVKNNMIWDIATYSGTTTLAYNALGIYVGTGAGYKIYNNTVNLGTQLSATGSINSAAFAVSSSISVPGALDIQNNIFVNTQTTSTTSCYAIYSAATANNIFSTINYNDYWVPAGSNLGYIGSNRTALADIVTGFGGNTNSKNIAPSFLSSTDVHLNAGSNVTLDNLGTVIAGVTDDIDGQTRSVATPDMGADEFTTVYCAGQAAFVGAGSASPTQQCTSGIFTINSNAPQAVGLSFQWESATTASGPWTTIANATNFAYTTATITATTFYHCLMTCAASGLTTTSDPITATIIPPPTIVITPSNGGFFCGSGTLTASGASNYTWSPVTNLFTDTTFTTAYVAGAFATTVYSNTTTNITYTATGTDSVTGCVNSTPIAVGPPVILLTSSVPNFCGTGGLVTLTASSPDSAMTYAWTSLTSPTVLDATTGSVVTSTIAATSDFKVIGTGSAAFTGCTSVAYASIGVYPLPTATVTTTANGVCPGTSATIGSGLSAGNFSVQCITHAWITTPTSANVLCSSGVKYTPSGVSADTSLDDGKWGGVPIGFGFNYFGTTFSTCNVGTNGVMNFGPYASFSGSQYSFPNGFPSTLSPLNTIGVLATDFYMTTSGSVKYWTQGYAPNRIFVLQYEDGPGWTADGLHSVQCHLYETTGLVEIHVKQATGVGTFAGYKTIGLQNGDGSVGAIAPVCGSTTTPPQVWKGLFATIQASAPQAWRFSPPSNYTTSWFADGTLIPSTTTPVFTNPGTNVFNLTVAPTVTTTYSISYQNQTTGCSSVAGTNTQVLMAVLGNVAPLGVTTTSTASGSICAGTAVTFGTDYVGSPDGITMQWQVSTNGGTSFTDITAGYFELSLANPTPTFTSTPTVAGIYRCKITACNGVPSYSTNSPITFTYNITASAGATRCGTGTLDLTATGDATVTDVKWYADATSNSVLFSGSPFTTPVLNTTTTYYVGVKVGTCSSNRVAVEATIIPAPVLTLSQTAVAICVGVPSSAVTITAGSTSYDSYVWSPTTGITGNETTGWIFNPAVTTSYTLTASQTGGQLCATTITVPVTVNATPLTVASSMDTLCEGGSTVLSANPIVSGPQTAPTGYAASTATNVADEEILNVTFGTLNATSTCTSGNNLYTDNTSLTPPTFNAGTTVPISIQVGTCGTFSYSNFTNVFIDYNRDGVFDATTERVYSSAASTTGAHLETGSITIPLTATPGVTRMRVMNVEFGSATNLPTGTYFYGETEDYNINIRNIVPLSETLTYVWSPASSLSATTGAVVTASPTITTTYSVTATNPSTGCTKTETITINVNEVPQITGPTELCMPNTITLENGVAHGVWSSSNVDVATVTDTGIVSGVSSGTVTISYAVSFANPVGCVITRTYTVTVNSPPTVVSYTQSQTILTGNNTTFAVNAIGSGLTYQWEVSNGSLPLTFTPITNTGIYAGATTNTLSLTGVPVTNNGYLYHCVVSGIGSCASSTSTNAILNVGQTGIVTHPLNVALCNSGNGTATYTALGEGVVQGYAWQVNTGTGFAPITDGTVAGLTYAGATTATLTVSGITIANSGWSFKCIISGPTNNPVTNTATLTVNQQLSFPITLADQTVCYSGGVANYAVAPLGTATGYQWQYSTEGTTWNSVVNGTPAGATYTGATTNALVVTTTAAISVSGTYYYRAQAIAALSCADAFSNGARLFINNPTITTQAVDATVADGSSVNFTVVANATAPTYQWKRATSLNGTYTNVVNDTPVGLTYLGDTTASLNVSTAVSTAASASNYYSVVVTSNGCSVSSTGALLTITNYCASAASSVGDEELTNVTFGTLNNTSACASLVGSQGTATGTADKYSNFRATVAPPELHAIGMTVPISVQVSLCAGDPYSHQVNVYFDFNHNGLLTDAGEDFVIYSFANSNTHTINANITIPADALTGTTLMRVVCKESSITGPCLVSSYGETEDYTVNLQQPYPCAGAPLAGTVTSTVANICYAGTAVLNLTGYTSDLSGIGIRWEKSYDGANWTVIPGETTSQLATGTISQETVFHAVVTCANGNVSSTSDPYTISVESPTVVSVANATRCGTGTVTLSAVISNSDTVKWYTSDTGGVAIGSGNTFTTPIITTTTGYYVEATTVNCTSVRAQVIATVTTPPAVGLGSTTATICEGQSTPAVMVTVGDTVYDTFDWAPLGSVSGDIFSGYTFNPSVTTTYTLTASQSSGTLCANTATYTVTVNPRPSEISISPLPASVCVNTVLPLVATGGTVGSSGTATIGTGTTLTTTTEQPTAFCNRWPSYRSQTIYTAAELTAAGIAAGTISSLAYNTTTLGDGATNANFTVMIGATTATAFTATAFASTASYTTVYGPSTYTHTASGWQTINFTTPYVWDGTSNIVINISQSGADSTYNSQTYYTATTDNKTLYTLTSSANTPSYSTKRLNVKLDWTSSVPTTLAWTPTTNLYSDAAGTTPYTGQNVSTVYVNSSTAGQTLYTTTATTTFGCIRTGTVDVTVNPDTTIALGSGNTTPTVCVNNAIAAITYTLGYETNATVTGLPAGVTGTYAAGVFTISGTPTESGTFAYTVTATGLCLPASLSGTITVNPDTTIALTSGGAIQTLCVNNAITDIVYGVTNGTGVTVTGLPTGVTGSYVAGVYTISGTPTVSGTFDYTVTTTGLCVQQSLSGTITVNPDTTLTWTSGSDAQTLCENNAITNIVYAVGNGTATVTGLPTGVTGNYASGVVTISGTPTVAGTFNYTVTTSGLCVQTSATGTIIVNPTTTLALTSGNTAQTLCVDNAMSTIVYAIGNGTGATVTGLPAGVTANYVAGVFTISGTPTVSGTFAYTVTPTGLCVIASLSGTISVNASTAITTQPASQVACPRSSVTFATVAQGVGLTYQWYFNGVAITNATSATYTIGFVNPTDAGVYTVAVGGGCSSNVTSNSAFLAVQAVPAPTGTSVQTAVQGALLSSIVASGTNIIWYATLADAQAGTNPLSLSYVLPVGTTTFYATQTVNGCQSYATLAVTMSVALGTKGFDLAALVYYPNPVTEMFNISYKLDIESIEVFNIVGQRILEAKPNMLTTQVDMSALPSGTYMMLVKADGASKVIKVVKK